MVDTLDLRFYRWILMRRLPLTVPIMGVSLSVGLVLALGLPPVYRAAATLLVEPPQISSTLAPSTVPENAIEQLQIIEQQTMTAANLLVLADQFGIYRNRSDMTSADIVKDMRSRAQVEPITFDTPSGSNGAVAFSISFEAREAALAASVANQLVERILTGNQQFRNDKAGETLQFFQNEVKRLNAQLSDEERQILSFKNAHTDALPDSMDFHRRQQSDLQERLLQIGREEAALRSRRANLKQFTDSTGVIETSAAATPEEQLLAQYRRTLVEQRSVFSDSSPAIAALRSRITTLENEVRNQRSGTDPNQNKQPASQLDLQFADIDGQLSFFQQERTAIQASLETISKLIAATPGNETTLNALQRTSQNTQSEYTLAVARLATASTGEQIETQSKGQRLTLVEQALTPQDPVRPSRIKIVLASLMAGLAIAGGLIILLELINNTVRRPIDLVRKLGIEPFATIPAVRTRRQNLVRRLALPVFGFLLIAAVPAAAYTIDTYHAAIGGASSRLLSHLGVGR